MRKVLQLIRRFWNLILFIILEVVSLALISKRNSIQGVDIVNSSNAIVGFFDKKQNDVMYYFRLRRMNDSLMNENARLRNEIAIVSGVDTFADSMARVYQVVKPADAGTPNNPADSNKKKAVSAPTVVRYKDYVYIPARVINNSIADDRMNYITLNRGRKAGIDKNMYVVTGNGIVGRVVNVSDNYATVITVISEGRKYSAQLIDGTSGFLSWEKGAPEYVYMSVPLQQKVKKGDSVFASQYSGFPDNILAGTVARIDTAKANNTLKLRVKLSTNFRKLQYVYVVRDDKAEEKTRLEAKNKQE